MAGCKRCESLVLPHQYGVAQTLLSDRPHFDPNIQAPEIRVGHFPTRREHARARLG